MFSTTARLIVFLAALQILGGHWMALQSAAWLGMLASYSRGETLVEAIEKTFDGEHPCALCAVVKSGRAEEQKQNLPKTIVKLEAVLGAVWQLPLPRVVAWRYSSRVPKIDARAIAPPTPPPQAA